MRHNNQLPNAHFHKDWQRRVKTWFDQPGRKKSRRIARTQKASQLAPRPLDGPLRPSVKCPTLKYNMKMRKGRGFTHEELREAGVTPAYARTIGISVDHRRRNKSVEGLQLNVERIKSYLSKLILFPKKSSSNTTTTDTTDTNTTKNVSSVLPVLKKYPLEQPRKITSQEREFMAHDTLRKARVTAKLVGIRAVRAKAKAEEEEAAKK